MKTVKIEVELSDLQAWEYAQFLKRATWRDYRDHAENDEQAYAMRDAGDLVRSALASAGYEPR